MIDTGFIKTLFVVGAVLCGAAALGLFLGELSAPKEGRFLREELARQENESRALAMAPVDRDAPPVFFLAGMPKDGDWTLVREEIQMAAERNVHQYVLPVRLPWPEQGPSDSLLDPLRIALEVNPRAAFLLTLDFNPPESWLLANIEAARTQAGKPLTFPSLASPKWLGGAKKASSALHAALVEAGLDLRVLGVVLGGLREGRWRHPDHPDDSPTNRSGFRTWLRTRYSDDATLQIAWGDDKATFDQVVPPISAGQDEAAIFFGLPGEQANADFIEYTSWQTASAINNLAQHWKNLAGPTCLVLANYGHGLELPRNSAGHGALRLLLDGSVDGFVSPVSFVDRGIGGVGGMMGPTASALAHGKRWFLIDDARTGLAKDPATGRPVRMKGLNRRDVFNVQRRNFALAMTQGMGIVWADPLGQGAHCEEAQWDELGRMRDIVAERWEARRESPTVTQASPDLLVVYDERARIYVKNGLLAHTALLQETRDAVLRTGLSAQFCLLDDFLDAIAPPAPTYLFLNLLLLDKESREALHARLASEGAAALWRYAPGYFSDEVSGTQAVGDTVRMRVRTFGAPETAGSVYSMDGAWISGNEAFGAPELWDPLCYIDDVNTDVLAHYARSGKASVALRQLEEGWTSVFIAEPGITPALIREILYLLERPLYPVPSSERRFDPIFAGAGLLAFHAAAMGERGVQLPEACDVRDLFDPTAGWFKANAFVLSMKTGETRLLEITPLKPEPAGFVPTEDRGNEGLTDAVTGALRKESL